MEFVDSILKLVKLIVLVWLALLLMIKVYFVLIFKKEILICLQIFIFFYKLYCVDQSR